MNRQSQKSGDNSVNTQIVAENVIIHSGSSDDPSDLLLAGEGPLRFSWHDIRSVIVKFDQDLSEAVVQGGSLYDLRFLDLDGKNILNGMGEDYFDQLKLRHEPYFLGIQKFLSEPANEAVTEAYGRVADELNFRLAVFREELGAMERVILYVHDEFLKANPQLEPKRNLVLMMLNFMYASCDWGRKV